ncbi:MAG: electron transfer flavoprotein-ubiquinone oxidoreductase [Syntrophobacteraceae bacterium]
MSEHESMNCGVVIVGAGPAGLSCALHLLNLINSHNQAVESGTKKGRLINEDTLGVDVPLMIIEKGTAVGDHSISGAVMNPNGLAELIPNFMEKGAPLESPAKQDSVLFLTAKGSWKLPVTPPTMHNDGNYIVSLTKLVSWLGEQVSELGQDIYATFSGKEILYDESNALLVKGVRCGDKGVNPDGTHKSNYEAGMDLFAKATVLCEGSRGSLTKQLIKKLDLDSGRNPQVYATGVKEVWQLPEGRLADGRVIHTMGYPLDRRSFGGGFIYKMSDNKVSVGMISALDVSDPQMDPHKNFCKFKAHPLVREILNGGKMLCYGAKTLPEGGWNSVPKLAGSGFMICGDGASLINVPRLKGINYAIKSGMLAAETIFECMEKADFGPSQFEKYQQRIETSWVGQDLKPFRNFRPLMKKGVVPWGLLKAGISYYSGGIYPFGTLKLEPDSKELKPMSGPAREKQQDAIKFDNESLLFDKLTDVYLSGAKHEEKQPCHLQLDATKCKTCYETYGAPCEAFCPAQVYNIVRTEQTGEFERIQVDFSNCVHCKTCDIRDPYEAINWVCPEGGGGPRYNTM